MLSRKVDECKPLVAGDAFDTLLGELHSRLRYHRNSPYRFYAVAESNG
jgi:hypothetical protein